MIKKIFASILVSINLLAISTNELITDEDILNSEKLLNMGIKNNDNDTLFNIGTFYYKGNFEDKSKNKIYNKKGLLILEEISKSGYIPSNYFLITDNLTKNRFYETLKFVKLILKNKKLYNNKNMLNNVVKIYASIILDISVQNEKEENSESIKIIKLFEEYNLKDIDDKFFLSFLYKRIGMPDIANMYLNETCNNKDINKYKKIKNFCYSDIINIEE